MQSIPYTPKPESCDFCGLNEAELRTEYNFIEGEEITFYHLGQEGEIVICEFCQEHR